MGRVPFTRLRAGLEQPRLALDQVPSCILALGEFRGSASRRAHCSALHGKRN